MKTSTYFSLMAEFKTAQIPLADICEKYFKLKHSTAKRQAARQTLPVPAVLIRKDGHNNYFIMAEHLAELIDTKAEEAHEDWVLANAQ
ncbi:MAG TPA: pyocin activator protein PrtN [Candidatus Thioglobus sp.]|nr:pyocin activator protein PrtN [Candidatus Thioglobus sp.]